jgi:hypothetical protein
VEQEVNERRHNEQPNGEQEPIPLRVVKLVEEPAQAAALAGRLSVRRLVRVIVHQREARTEFAVRDAPAIANSKLGTTAEVLRSEPSTKARPIQSPKASPKSNPPTKSCFAESASLGPLQSNGRNRQAR